MTGISRLREQAMRIGPRESPRMPVLRTASLRPIFKREIPPPRASVDDLACHRLVAGITTNSRKS
jgi:hypothetical protein